MEEGTESQPMLTDLAAFGKLVGEKQLDGVTTTKKGKRVAGKPAEGYIQYLESRVSMFEAEREPLMEKIDALTVSRQEEHTNSWEMRKCRQKTADLQSALSAAHAYLFEERERLLATQAENDDLKLQEMEDRKRIQHLLALTAPLEEEITFNRGAKPEGMTIRSTDKAKVEMAAAGMGKMKAGGDGDRVMRTVYLPTANTDSLLLRVESLQAQLHEQKQFAKERIAALIEDRKIREQDDTEARNQFSRQVEDISTRLEKTEKLLQKTTKDFLVERRKREQTEGEAAAIVQDAEEAKAQAVDFIKVHEQKIEDARAAMEEEKELYLERFREQLREREEEIVRLDAVHASVRAAYEKRIADLERKNKQLQDYSDRLEERRALDIEGFGAATTALRQQLNSLERRLLSMRLEERLADDDRLEAMLEKLERQPLHQLSGQGKKGKKVSKKERKDPSLMAQELSEIRSRLDGITDRVNDAEGMVDI